MHFISQVEAGDADQDEQGREEGAEEARRGQGRGRGQAGRGREHLRHRAHRSRKVQVRLARKKMSFLLNKTVMFQGH